MAEMAVKVPTMDNLTPNSPGLPPTTNQTFVLGALQPPPAGNSRSTGGISGAQTVNGELPPTASVNQQINTCNNTKVQKEDNTALCDVYNVCESSDDVQKVPIAANTACNDCENS